MLSVRVRPGIQATLVDLSSNGAQLETAHRLLQGRFVHIQFLTERGVTTVRGRTVRNHVSLLSASVIRYRSAVRFDRAVMWHADQAPELLTRA